MEEVFKRRQSTTTNPEIINQLKELEHKIRAGYSGAEIGLTTFRHWSQIPNEIWNEIARKARINKLDLTIHAPFSGSRGSIFPNLTGMRTTERGYVIDDIGKEQVSYELKAILETAANLGKIYGDSIKVTVHATSALPSASWNKEYEEKLKENLRNNPDRFNDLKNKLLHLGLIKREEFNKIKDPNDLPAWVFSSMVPITMELPDGYAIIDYIDLFDRRYLSEKVFGMKERLAKKEIDETIIDRLYKYNEEYFNRITGDMLEKANKLKKEFEKLSRIDFGSDLLTGEFLGYLNNIKSYIDSIYNTLNLLYFSYLKERREEVEKIKYIPTLIDYIVELRKKINDINLQIKNVLINYDVGSLESRKRILEILDRSNIYQDIQNFVEREGKLIFNFALQEIKNLSYPVIKPFPSIALESAVDSFKRSIDKFLADLRNKKDYLELIDKVFPKIFFEHIYPEDFISRPEILKEFVEKSRKALLEVLDRYPEIKNKIIEKFGNLENFASEYVGITLDVAHLKMFEKYGYKKEDIIRWIRDIKPYVKHIHVSESKYGEDTHIPLGMEKDEIIKAELEELKDLLAQKGISIVHEIGGWYSGEFHKDFGSEYQYFLYYGTPGGEYHIETFYRPTILSTYYGVVYTADLPTLTITYSGFSDIPIDLGSFRKEQKQDYFM